MKKIFNSIIIFLLIALILTGLLGGYFYYRYEQNAEKTSNVEFIRLADKSVADAYKEIQAKERYLDSSMVMLKVVAVIGVLLFFVLGLKIVLGTNMQKKRNS